MERAIEERRSRIIEDIEENREELDAAVQELKHAAAEWIKPTRLVARNPYPFLAAALFIGLWAGRRR